MELNSILAVFLGGGLGSLCRFGVSAATLKSSSSALPYATLASNVLSCIVMAIALNWFMDKMPEGSWQRLFLLVGFCGGFSTFSTFSLENFQLMRDGQFGFLIANIMLSVLLCLMVFWLIVKKG